MKAYSYYCVDCYARYYREVFYSKGKAKKRFKQLSKQHPQLKFNLIRITRFY